MMLAKDRPDLVRCVVLLDAPLVAGWKALTVRVSKWFGLHKRFSPGRYSERRRNQWADAEEAYQHFASKEMFSIWAPGVLRDYIQAGTEPAANGNGLSLKFQRDIETAIYYTLPHDLSNLARQGLQVPIGFVGGTESVECRMAGLAATKKLVGENFVQIPYGHLLTMEAPQQTAQQTHRMILSLLKSDVAAK